MKKILLLAVCLMAGLLHVSGLTGIGQERPVAYIDGYVHAFRAAESERPVPQFALYPVEHPQHGPFLLLGDDFQKQFADLQGRRIAVVGYVPFVLSEGPFRGEQAIHVDDVIISDDERLAQLLRDEMDERGHEVFGGFNEPPEGDFDAENFNCPSGAAARSITLYVPPPELADGQTDTAYVCDDSSQYWVNRTGGLAGVSLWAGPFELPFVTDVVTTPRIETPPSAAKPKSLRTRRRAHKRRVTVRRDVLVNDQAPRDLTRYVPSDFDLGEGITVLKVLRVKDDRVRLRVLVDRDAEVGEHVPRVLGRSGEATLRVRPRRRR